MKSTDESDEVWKFAGIASDEEEDIEGDKILRKAVDLSYAKSRGYVNWNHSREPEDQLGYITKADIIEGEGLNSLQESFGISLSKTASVYMEGELYKGVDKAAEVMKIMTSTPEGAPGLGLSLDGVMARDVMNKGVVKAFVRGVAITPEPAHPKTLLRLKKSLQGYAMLEGEPNIPIDLPATIADRVVQELRKSMKSEPKGMTRDQAAFWVLKKRPHWSLELAEHVVDYSMSQLDKETTS